MKASRWGPGSRDASQRPMSMRPADVNHPVLVEHDGTMNDAEGPAQRRLLPIPSERLLPRRGLLGRELSDAADERG